MKTALVLCVALLLAGCREPVPPGSFSIESNQLLTGWPHTFDVYRVTGATQAIVFLHGGSGTKEYSAAQLGIRAGISRAKAGPNAGVLVDYGMTAVFPQGQGEVPTWSNYVMDSGVDDVAFLRDLVAYLKASGFQRVYVAGHSNGGMMASRLWCEAPELFDGYVAIAGPPSEHFAFTPCAPATAKPLLSIVGSMDDVLQNQDWNAATWTIAPRLTRKGFVDPDLIAGPRFFADCVRLSCGGVVTTTTSGSMTMWYACDGRVRLVRIEGAQHSIESLQEHAGTDLLGMVLEFAVK
jgi:poly(3-hydroxybutyrate) depolymerase